jgi:oligoendopeptidase F
MAKTTPKTATKSSKSTYKWNLGLLYASPTDPKIEQDMLKAEKVFSDFAKKYDTSDKTYLKDSAQLLVALTEYEKLHEHALPRPLMYFFFAESLNSSDSFVNAQNSLLSSRMAKAANVIRFFPLALGAVPEARQKELLADSKFKHFNFFLRCVFSDAKYQLSGAEEKILSLKNLPAKELWISHNNKILGTQEVTWKGKIIPVTQAFEIIGGLASAADRKKLASAVYEKLKGVAVFSEGEINAVFTDKKITDELRGYKTPYAETVREYRNDEKVIENLRAVVTENFPLAQRFYKLKAKLLKLKHLNYCDRSASIGKVNTSFSFDDSVSFLKKTFGEIDQKYADILDSYVTKGQIDVFPAKGKTSGAYCAGSYSHPTFVLLNHVDKIRSLSTLAHEMGHAFHGELSRNQGPMYSDYSTALAETASTLFEGIAFEAMFETLSKKEQVILLHDKINESISTIHRQIACFNFELDLHSAIRTKGFVPKEEIAALHNKNMHAYLGPVFKMTPDDGYMFVSWSHIRRFFYVYSYAYGLIVSQALLRKYRKDPSFWKNIERFLSAGGKDTPENILKEVGIDVTKPDFFKEGLKAIEEDIDKLESLL